MKRLQLILLFTFISTMIIAQAKIQIGMTLDEVKKKLPNAKIEPSYYPQIILSQPANLYGLENPWNYVFGEKKKKLVQIYFLKYNGSNDEATFNKCLSATQNIIKEYTEYYGKPDSMAGKTKFDQKYRLNHDRFLDYNILEAYWKNYNNMEIVVGFHIVSSSGIIDKQGKMPLNLVVRITIQKKNLSYDDY